MKPLLIATLLLAAILSPVAGQTTYEREAKQLKEQRDKAVADSAKAINVRYQAALEQVYRRALQAKDASSDSIKTELETLGPLRQPGLTATPLSTTANTASLPRTMLGKWNVVAIGGWKSSWEFKEDGTCAITPGTAKIPDKVCTWSKNKDAIEVRYPDGGITQLEWPIKSGKLEGNDKAGGKVWLSKAK